MKSRSTQAKGWSALGVSHATKGKRKVTEKWFS